MNRCVAIVQARMSSTRFPGKVLAPLAGVPLIVFMVQRVRAAKRLDDVVLATSADPSDDALADAARRHGIRCHRGSLDDVLERFRGAAEAAAAGVVVRLTGDCPLIDADVIDEVVDALRRERADYASNVDPPTFPDGLDVEAFTREALERTAREAAPGSEREHVTPYMRGRKDLFRQALVRSVVDLSALRWTVDYPDDLALVERVVERARCDAGQPDRFDFLRALSRVPGWEHANRHARNEGYAASLARQGSAS